MVLALAPPRLGPAALLGERGGSRVVSNESAATSGFVRWSVLGVVALSLVAPLDAILVTVTNAVHGLTDAVAVAVVAAVLLLPPYLYLVTSAARGHRHPRAGWLLVAVAVAVLIATPAVGTGWLPAFGALGLAALLVLPPRWAALVFVAVLLAQFPLAAGLGDPSDGLWGVLLVSKSLAVYVLARLTAAARQLEETRALLATDAIVQERLRIDDEMRRTVGADLAAIAEQGERLSTAADTEVADQLTDLVGRSRATLARARRLVAGYRRQSLRTELDTAATLLRADGIPTRVCAPDHLPGGTEEIRERLRAETSRLLRDGRRPGSCTITVTVDGGAVHLDVRTGEPTATTSSTTTRTPA